MITQLKMNSPDVVASPISSRVYREKIKGEFVFDTGD